MGCLIRSRRHADNGGVGPGKISLIEQRAAFADAGQADNRWIRRHPQRRIESGNRQVQNLRRALRRAVRDRAVGLPRAERHGGAIVLGEVDIRETRQRQHLADLSLCGIGVLLQGRRGTLQCDPRFVEIEVHGGQRAVAFADRAGVVLDARGERLHITVLVRHDPRDEDLPFRTAVVAVVGEREIADRAVIRGHGAVGILEVLRIDDVGTLHIQQARTRRQRQRAKHQAEASV